MYIITKFARTSIVLMILFCLMMGLSSCSKQNDIPEPQPGSSNKAKLNTTANLTSGFGHGVNLQPSYYHGGNVDLGWNLMKQNTKIKTVRIEIEPNQVNNAKRWIQEAVSNGFKVIATYHKSTVLGSDNNAELQAAANWWKTNYSTLRASGDFTINLMNEWGSHNITAKNYAISYNQAITTVRSVYSGAIVIDIPGWGQETATAAAAVKGYNTDGVKINDTNIILSVHIYPSAWNQGKNGWLVNSDLDDLASAGRPCLVGEFGNGGSGSANWSGLVDYAKSKGGTVLGWAWNGDGTGMNMISPQFQPFVSGQPKTYTKSGYFNTVYNKL